MFNLKYIYKKVKSSRFVQRAGQNKNNFDWLI